MSKREKIHSQVFYFSLIALAAAIPTNSILVNLSIIALSANWVLEGDYIRKLRRLSNPLVFVFMIFYLWHVVGMIHSDNLQDASRNIEKKLILLVFPILISTPSWTLDRKQVKNILVAFVIGCASICVLAVGIGLKTYVQTGDSQYLLHELLAENVGMQSIYLAIYLCMATAIILWILIETATSTRILLLLADVFFFFMTVILSARMSMAVLVLTNLVGGFYYSYRIGRLKWFFAFALILLTVGVVLVIKLPILNDRVMELVNTKFYFDPAENNANGLTLRLVKWQCSIEGWSANPVMGVGTGDTQDFLQACYKVKNFWGEVFAYNSHNQFLQTALGLGTIGLLSLLACFILPVRAAFLNKDYLYLAFIFILAVCFLTESVLERKQGVVFFSFFHALFVFSLIRKDTKPA